MTTFVEVTKKPKGGVIKFGSKVIKLPKRYPSIVIKTVVRNAV